MKLRNGIFGLTLTSALALAAFSANAADMYRAAPAGGYKDEPVYAANTWTGFYAGVNGGYGWSAQSDQLRDLSNGPHHLFNGLEPSGGFGGGQIGYNWQGALGQSHLVLGVEADIEGADITDTVKWSLATSKSEVDWFGTVRGRLGYAFDRTLVYATGGFAYGHVSNSEIGGAVYKADDTATGYVVGGGIEYKINPAWSIKGEYQFINLGKTDPTTATGVKLSSFPGVTVNDDEFHTVRVGLNYHVGQSYEPLK